MVLVYSDDKKITIEMLGKAIELGKETKQKVTAVIIGKPDDVLAKEYISLKQTLNHSKLRNSLIYLKR